jgi:hypothetical protein
LHRLFGHREHGKRRGSGHNGDDRRAGPSDRAILTSTRAEEDPGWSVS